MIIIVKMRLSLVQFHICVVTVLFSILLTATNVNGHYSSSSRNEPTISSVKWADLEGVDWESDLGDFGEDAIAMRDNGKTWIVSHHIKAIAFTCNASYPVMWIFERAQFSHDDDFSMEIRTFRRVLEAKAVADLTNPRMQQYISTIEIYGEFNRMTGRYSCQSTQDERNENSVYLYWQGQSASYLVLSGETLKIRPTENNQTAVLPCYVSYPEGHVTLLKNNGKEYVPMPSNGEKDGLKVSFDSKIGFTLQREGNNISLMGKYKCEAETPDDYTLMNVEYDSKSKFHVEDILLGTAKYYFDPQKDELVCCSNTGRPPILRDIFCSHVAICRIHEHQLLKIENNGQRARSGGCTSMKMYQRETGMFRCKGDAIDITRHFYTDFSQPGNDAFNAYFSWGSIPSGNMMKIIPHFNGTVYNKQILSVSCAILPSYFSEGIRWGLKRKDSSDILLDAPEHFFDPMDLSTKIHHKMDITVSMDISEIFCYAPVWNSTEWVHKSVNLQVAESVAPVIEHGDTEVYWTLGDAEQILECKSSGVPTPSIKWEKDGRRISKNSKNIWEGNGTSVLIIASVSRDTHGSYKCFASNWAGKASVNIDVIVSDPSHAWSTASIVTLSVLVVVLASVTAFIMYKMQLKSKIIAHLTRTVFRDMEPNSGTQSH